MPKAVAMPRFDRMIYFNGPGGLGPLLRDPHQAVRLLEAVRQSAPFERFSQSTGHAFSPDWLTENFHLQKMDPRGADARQEKASAEFVVVTDARYVFKLDEERLCSVLQKMDADVTAVTICPELQAGKEAVCLTSDDRVAGFRRLYEDTIEPGPPTARPHLMIIKKNCLQLDEKREDGDWDLERLRQWTDLHGFKTLHLRVGGRLLDLDCEPGLEAFLSMHSLESPLAGTIVVDSNTAEDLPPLASGLTHLRIFNQRDNTFRLRRFFSYARLGKRLFDILVSLSILLILLPLLLVMAMLVKITSPGPVFYGARRQGLHGKTFDCLKFRTMIVQAESFQDRLRAINQVDGPQFKIENDPRISGIGKFLRDTCIDELPQFLNVLAGQMSVVGPRPSPAAENECCPSWRDARLSVRPGITGLWQVCRTRQASMDFQEWVYYDTKYVKNLSFFTDLRICFKTARKLICNFLDQFG